MNFYIHFCQKFIFHISSIKLRCLFVSLSQCLSIWIHRCICAHLCLCVFIVVPTFASGCKSLANFWEMDLAPANTHCTLRCPNFCSFGHRITIYFSNENLKLIQNFTCIALAQKIKTKRKKRAQVKRGILHNSQKFINNFKFEKKIKFVGYAKFPSTWSLHIFLSDLSAILYHALQCIIFYANMRSNYRHKKPLEQQIMYNVSIIKIEFWFHKHPNKLCSKY